MNHEIVHFFDIVQHDFGTAGAGAGAGVAGAGAGAGAGG